MLNLAQIPQIPQAGSNVLALGSDACCHGVGDRLPLGCEGCEAARGERDLMLRACLAASAVIAGVHGWRQSARSRLLLALEHVHGGDMGVAFVNEGLHAGGVGVGFGVRGRHGNAG